uniref:Immunoglobulin subtype domain-containing protein n=1 Tax=Dicentrarchus labrax TaxID=13489 RepID=A0A8C4GGU8_DICLA
MACIALLLFTFTFKLHGIVNNTAVYKESGESITLECSSAGCPSSIEGYTGMYLYHEFKELDEVLYFHSKPGTADKITPRPRYKNRTQTEGPLKNHTITISNLTVDDTGLYRCAFIKFPGDKVRCNVYTLIVGGAFFLLLFKNCTQSSLKCSKALFPPLHVMTVTSYLKHSEFIKHDTTVHRMGPFSTRYEIYTIKMLPTC